MKANQLQQALLVASDAAQAAGVVLRKYWGKLTKVTEKSSSSDLVTEADQESESQIKNIIQKAFPDHSILAEESGLEAKPNTKYLWAIDPLDGTTNYAHQFPVFCISIGLFENQNPILGLVYDPIREEIFQAANGLGASLNGAFFHVSSVKELAKSLLATGFAYDRLDSKDKNYEEFYHLTQMTHGVRRLGAAALDLSYVACGRLDGFWERGLQIWDMAAAVVIIKEAGGQVSSYDGSPLNLKSGRILATNGHIHQALSHELLTCSKLTDPPQSS